MSVSSRHLTLQLLLLPLPAIDFSPSVQDPVANLDALRAEPSYPPGVDRLLRLVQPLSQLIEWHPHCIADMVIAVHRSASKRAYHVCGARAMPGRWLLW